MVVRALAVRPPSPLQGQVTSTGGGGVGLGHDLCAAVVRQHQSRRWGSGLTGGPAPVAVAGAVTVPLSIGAAGGGGVASYVPAPSWLLRGTLPSVRLAQEDPH
jgi:hypothetical protein